MVLGLLWCNVGFTNDVSKIEDIEINGISIGDNLLDHFSKQALIQNKELLEANTAKQKLYYTSLIDQGMFYYESNEKVDMTEKPIYRIIGMSLGQSCDERSRKDEFSEDESLRLLTKCIEKSFTKKLIKFDNTFLNLLDLYFEKKNDPEIQVMENGSLTYVESTKLGTGCYSDNIRINYFSEIAGVRTLKKNGERAWIEKKYTDKEKLELEQVNMYYGPSMNIFLMSKELEEILYFKYC